MNGPSAPIQLRKPSQPHRHYPRAWRFVLLLFAMLVQGQLASAAEFDDITVRPQLLASGETHHGYRELRVWLRNRSPDEAYEITLNFPGHSYRGGNTIQRVSRTVSMRPGASAVVPMWQPPLPAAGSSDIEVLIDGVRAGTVTMPGDFRHMTRTAGVRYGAPNPPATILVSRSLNLDEVDRKLKPAGSSVAAFAASTTVGAPDAGTPRTIHPNAWTPDGALPGPHWLEVEYATPIAATDVRVHGTTRMFSGGTITVKGVSGTNLAVISLATPTSPRAQSFAPHSFGPTAEPVKAVRLDFVHAPRNSIVVDAIEVSGPSGSAWASSARASSEMPTSSAPHLAGGMETRELLRPELPVAEWSGSWISYTPYDGIVLTGTDLATAPPEVQSALWSYAECGGNLILLGGEVSEPWRSSPPTELAGGGKSFNTGFGRCFLFNADVSSLRAEAVQAVMDVVNKTARFWQSLPEADAANASFPVVENVRIPVRGTVLVMLVFVLVIGPVNLFVLTRMNRRVWMLWTIPAISVVTCLLVFAYSFLREGVTPDVRVEGLTLLDQASRRAVTCGLTAFYAPLTPRQGLLFDTETEATPLVDQTTHSAFGGPVGTPRTVDWTRSQQLQRGWVSARVPAHFHLRRAGSHRGRLQVEFSGGKANVMNGLGVPINWLWLADPGGSVYQAGEIPAGQTISVPAHTGFPRIQGDSGFQVLVSRIPGNSPILGCTSTNAANFLGRNAYIAELASDPFLENGLGPKAKSSRTRSRSIVYGILEKP